MKNSSSSLNVEQMLYENAQNIEIDADYKNALKKKIMAQSQKKARPSIKTSYLKAASIVAFAVVTGSAMFGANGAYNYVASKHNTAPILDARNVNEGKTEKSGDTSNNALKDNTETENDKLKTTAMNNKTNQAVLPEKNAQNGGSTSVNAPVPSEKSAPPSENTKTNTQQSSKPASNSGAAAAITNPGAASGSTQSQGAKSSGGQTNTENNKPQVSEQTDTPAEEEQQVTIRLAMVSGRYMIQSIKVLQNENVAALPEEYNSATTDEALKINSNPDTKAVYEKDGSIFMARHNSSRDLSVDTGRSPSLYEPINIVSYIKTDSTGNSGDTGEIKSVDSVWVFDGNSAMKYQVLTADSSKYSFIKTFWSKEGTQLYVLANNIETGKNELVKLTLEIK